MFPFQKLNKMQKEKRILKLKRGIEEIKKEYPEGKIALLPSLLLTQEIFGYLAKEGIELIAETLNLKEGEIWDTATFYQFLRKRPCGKNHLYICTNLTCLLEGAEDIVKYLEQKFNIKEGEVTEDGRFSFETCECIGLCDEAPAGIFNGKPVKKLTIEKIEKLIGRE
jgi:NADH:ubiquinone oxidoreductase subunit E